MSSDQITLLNRLNRLEVELEIIRRELYKSIEPKQNRRRSLFGCLGKGVEIPDNLFSDAKRSIFSVLGLK